MSGCAGRTFPMAVRELPSVTIASLAQEPNADCDATHAGVESRRCLATRSETDARAVVAMPGGRGAHNSNLNDAVRHDDFRQARPRKSRLRAGDGPVAGQRDPNKEAGGQKGPTTRQVAIAARVAAKTRL